MKTSFRYIIAALICGTAGVSAQSSAYTNFIRQVQFPSGVPYDASVAVYGEQLSQMAIDPGGARFELWTVHSETLASHLLSSTYVGTYTPVAGVEIVSEDLSAAIPRTRADRPFQVTVTVDGLITGDDVPEAAKAAKFLHHVQSYGVDGTGENIDRTQAILLEQVMVNENGSNTLSFMINSVPGADRSKVRGEERFSVYSLEDYQAPESQIASETIQIWPVADGSIAGISHGELIRYMLPQVTLTVNDLYPSSTTYAQVYKGNAQLGVTGKVVPGSAVVINDAVPDDRILVLDDYDEVFDEDGRWTMELVTVTPFGIDRLAYVTFDLDRTIKVNAAFTTIE